MRLRPTTASSFASPLLSISLWWALAVATPLHATAQTAPEGAAAWPPELSQALRASGLPADAVSWLVPQDALQDGEVVWVLQDARMGELYAASFRWAGDGWCPAEPPALWSLEEPRRRWQATTPEAPIKVCGNAWEACAPAFTGLAAEQVRRWGEAAAPSGAALASLAWQAWQAGAWVDPALALPRYVRDKVALTTAERQVPSGMMTA